jgi:hypothetical protein
MAGRAHPLVIVAGAAAALCGSIGLFLMVIRMGDGIPVMESGGWAFVMLSLAFLTAAIVLNARYRNRQDSDHSDS